MNPPLEFERLESRLQAALQRIQLVALDVDGTLTDGGIYYGPAGVEVQRFDVRDGLGLVRLKQAGFKLAFITGRGCPATARRARELEIDRYLPQCGPKDLALERLQAELELDPAATLAVGDDLPDLPLFARAGLCACPADAESRVRSAAQIKLSRPGGHGAVRELCELLLAAREQRAPRGAAR